MPHRTDIEWCDYSSNPLRAETECGVRGHACAKISPGCVNCYSEAINNRFGTHLDYTAANARKVTHYLDEKELRHILTFKPRPPFKNGRSRPAVFPFDMTDVFGDWVSDETLDRLFAAFALRPDVDFLILTKRAERMHDCILRWITGEGEGSNGEWRNPLPNVWLGVSAEDQQRADERIPWLLQTPAAVRFVSAEPLLGPVNLQPHIDHTGEFVNSQGINCDWVIVGGESGRGARECNIEWIRSIIAQCKAAGVACFVKQVGSSPSCKTADREQWMNDGCAQSLHSIGDTTLLRLGDRKGGDPDEWPQDLRVREMPQEAPCHA